MAGSIIMAVLALAALIGIGNSAVKDFRIPSAVLALVFGLIAGLNFIPQITVGGFSFSVGTAILFVFALIIWIFKGRMKNRLVCLMVTIVLSGLLYGATKLGAYYGSELWRSVNPYYALIVGALSFVATRNAKYGFIAAVTSIGIASVLTQIGYGINLDVAYTPAIISGALSIILYCAVARLMPSRPNKATYYFETGRMKD